MYILSRPPISETVPLSRSWDGEKAGSEPVKSLRPYNPKNLLRVLRARTPDMEQNALEIRRSEIDPSADRTIPKWKTTQKLKPGSQKSPSQVSVELRKGERVESQPFQKMQVSKGLFPNPYAPLSSPSLNCIGMNGSPSIGLQGDERRSRAPLLASGEPSVPSAIG